MAPKPPGGKDPGTFNATSHDNFYYERTLYGQGFSRVTGSDEVGRGPLAGPVVAAAVVLPKDCNPAVFVDSKQISHKKRLELFSYLTDIGAAIGIGIVSEKTIDRINILQASLLAMKRSVEALVQNNCPPDYLLVDGKFEIPLALPQQTLIKGESKSGSIAAASIAAKITRDNIMYELHQRFPLYNFQKHKGYPTREHRQAILLHGPCEVHRYSFKGVRTVDRETP